MLNVGAYNVHVNDLTRCVSVKSTGISCERSVHDDWSYNDQNTTNLVMMCLVILMYCGLQDSYSASSPPTIDKLLSAKFNPRFNRSVKDKL